MLNTCLIMIKNLHEIEEKNILIKYFDGEKKES
jgi:hypothetical protein